MKNISLGRMAALGLLLALLALGCGNLLGAVRSVQEVKTTLESAVTQVATLEALATQVMPTQAPAAQPTQAPPTAASRPAAHDPEQDDAVRTYRLRWVYRLVFEDDLPPVDISIVELVVNKDQQAQHMTVSGAGGTTLEWIQVGDQVWMRNAGNDWTVISAEQIMDTATLWDPQTLWARMEEASDWQPQGQEEVSGYPVTKYRFVIPQETWSGDTDLIRLPEVGEHYTIQANGPAEGWVWSTEDGLVLKMEWRFPILATDNQGQSHSGYLEWRYDVGDINAAVDIQPPAEAGGMASPIPVPGEAQLMVGQSNMWVYRVPGMDLAGLIDFYNQQAATGNLRLEGTMGGPDSGFWQATVVLTDGSRWQVAASPGAGELNLMIQAP